MGDSTGKPARILGLRAEPKAVTWAVVDGTREQPLVHASDRAAAPLTYNEPSALGWYRERILQLIDTYSPSGVSIREAESMSRGAGKDAAKRRSRLEGVLMEAAHSRRIPVLFGQLRTISAELGTKRAKQYLETGEFRGVDLSTVGDKAREAILVAAAQLPQPAESA